MATQIARPRKIDLNDVLNDPELRETFTEVLVIQQMHELKLGIEALHCRLDEIERAVHGEHYTFLDKRKIWGAECDVE